MTKIALVLGGADTLNKDRDLALSLIDGEPDTWVACNHAGRDLVEGVDHWCTLHTEKMPQWIAEREQRGLPPVKNYWTSNRKTIPDEHKNLYNHVESWDGSSGLLCVTVALHLGYDKIILCGVPLDRFAAHYDDTDEWADAPRYRGAWSRNLDKMMGKVKSCSGWTRHILGEPTKEWLYEGE